MPRIPEIGYRTQAPGPQGQARAPMDSGEGRGMQQLGQTVSGVSEVLLDIEARKKTREDTINRVRAINEYTLKADQEWTRITSEEDISSGDVVKSYHNYLQELGGEVLGAHAGAEQSRAELASQIESNRGQYALRSYNEGTKAQQKVLGDYAEGVIGRISAQAAEAPDSIMMQFADLDREMEKLAPALTPEQEALYRKSGRSQVVVRAATAYLDTGNYAAADVVISTPGIAELMDPDTLRQLKSQVVVGSLRAEKEAFALQAKGQSIERFIGRGLTAQEKLKLVGLAPSGDGRQTLSDRVAELSALGIPVTGEMVQKMAGALPSEGGTSQAERNMQTLMDLSDAVEAGVAAPEERRRFENALAIYSRPEQYRDEFGRVVTVSKPIPAYIQDAAQAAGIPIPGAERQDGVAVEPAPEGQPIPPEQTIFGMNRAGTLTGVVARGAELGGRIPIIGGALGGGGEYATNQKYVQTAARDLVRVLQNNPQYAVKEMAGIADELEIIGSAFDNSVAYEKRLIGLHRSLTERAEHSAKTAISAVDVNERMHARNVYNGILGFLPKMGMPRQVKSPDEVRKLVSEGALKPGDIILLPDGSAGTVPGGQ